MVGYAEILARLSIASFALLEIKCLSSFRSRKIQEIMNVKRDYFKSCGKDKKVPACFANKAGTKKYCRMHIRPCVCWLNNQERKILPIGVVLICKVINKDQNQNK